MGITISVKDNLDPNWIQPSTVLPDDSRIKLACQNTLAKRCDPYVPMKEGPLSQSTIVSEEGVTYTQPYAHYQYVGEVYGPSWPIKQDGIIVGWRSPAGKGSKHPTGRQLNYSKDKHPLATSHWDKAMMRDHKDEVCEEIKEIIKGEWINGR